MMNDMKNFNERVYDIVARIPAGRVITYGQAASMAGSVRASRAAGYAMFRCPRRDVPCHRVVYRDGSLAPAWAFGGHQRALLESEGVAFTEDDRVDMAAHGMRIREIEACMQIDKY